jgi:hypothetical protein
MDDMEKVDTSVTRIVRVSEVLDRAAALFDKLDLCKRAAVRWVKDERVACCTLGAIDLATHGIWDRWSTYSKAIGFVAQELASRCNYDWISVPRWNDRVETTKEDVVEVLKAAATRARAAEA